MTIEKIKTYAALILLLTACTTNKNTLGSKTDFVKQGLPKQARLASYEEATAYYNKLNRNPYDKNEYVYYQLDNMMISVRIWNWGGKPGAKYDSMRHKEFVNDINRTIALFGRNPNYKGFVHDTTNTIEYVTLTMDNTDVKPLVVRSRSRYIYSLKGYNTCDIDFKYPLADSIKGEKVYKYLIKHLSMNKHWVPGYYADKK